MAEALARECGEPYRGVLYGGFMATAQGVKLIEYNARFGDPEALNLLTLLETDCVDVCRAIVDGTLDALNIRFAAKASVCKYVVPEGYPEAPHEGDEVDLPAALAAGCLVVPECSRHAGWQAHRDRLSHVCSCRAGRYDPRSRRNLRASRRAKHAALLSSQRYWHGRGDPLRRVRHMQNLAQGGPRSCSRVSRCALAS